MQKNLKLQKLYFSICHGDMINFQSKTASAEEKAVKDGHYSITN